MIVAVLFEVLHAFDPQDRSDDRADYARVRVESRSKDDDFVWVDDLQSRNAVAQLDLVALCPTIAFNAGLTHPPQQVGWSHL
jgi:hypothetical protein